MIKELIKLAIHLDDIGYYKEADYLDEIIKKAGSDLDSKILPLSAGRVMAEEEAFGDQPVTRSIYINEIEPAIHQWVKQQIYVQTGKKG
jgi:hypothetical protein